MEVQAKCIKEWEEYICVFEKKMLVLEVVVDSLNNGKDEANKEFTKIEGQVEDLIMFVTTKEEVLVLQTTFHTQNKKVQGLILKITLLKM